MAQRMIGYSNTGRIVCRHCGGKITWATQRSQFARLIANGFSEDDAKGIMPRCNKCTTFVVCLSRIGVFTFDQLKAEIKRLRLIVVRYREFTEALNEIRKHQSAFGHSVYAGLYSVLKNANSPYVTSREVENSLGIIIDQYTEYMEWEFRCGKMEVSCVAAD